MYLDYGSLSKKGRVCMNRRTRGRVRSMKGVRQRRIRLWGVGLLFLAFLALMPVGLRAQEDDEGGRVAFAGGHMVRGTVIAARGDQVTVKTETGEVYQIVMSANTRLTKERQPVKATDIKVGDGVGAMGVLDAPTKTVHAVFVGLMDAEQVKKAREDLGKIYIVGKVKAIDMDALKLTVMRPDGVSQVIGVDEETSFKRGGRGIAAMVNGSGDVGSGEMSSAGGRDGEGPGSGGESITLADLKVGDSVAGRGAVKNGLFVPVELRVVDASARGQRRRAAAGQSATKGGAAPVAVPVTPQ